MVNILLTVREIIQTKLQRIIIQVNQYSSKLKWIKHTIIRLCPLSFLQLKLLYLRMMNKVSVDEYILNSGKWEDSLILLREILLDSGLEETVKWSMPVYTLDGRNVVGIVAFKSYTGIWFYQGVFLKDKKKVLFAADDGTGAVRQWRFQDVDQIRDEIEDIIEYIEEAIKNMKQGKIQKPNLNKPIPIPKELKQALEDDPHLKQAYLVLSKSKRREFGRYIDQAKMLETRDRRLRRVVEMIREARGLW